MSRQIVGTRVTTQVGIVISAELREHVAERVGETTPKNVVGWEVDLDLPTTLAALQWKHPHRCRTRMQIVGARAAAQVGVVISVEPREHAAERVLQATPRNVLGLGVVSDLPTILAASQCHHHHHQ